MGVFANMWTLLLAAALAKEPAKRPLSDRELCQVAQEKDSFEAWEAYLVAHPGGVCAAMPQARDAKACMFARGANSRRLWLEYSRLHPKGMCTDFAVVIDRVGDMPPGLQIASPVVLGKLDDTVVIETVAPRWVQLHRDCWDEALGAGKLVAILSFTDAGYEPRLRDSTFEDETFHSCVLDGLHGLALAPEAGRAVVTLPVWLGPRPPSPPD